MTTWTKQKLGDIYKFQYGQGNTNPSNGGKYPVYGAGNIIGYFDEYNAENSPVIGHMGANCGTVIFGKGKHFVTYNGIMALIKNGNDPQFGYYTLLSKDFRKSIRGSAQPFISYDLLNNVDIYLPDPATQSRISKVISAYDALIENNEKRIRIMEEMAQRFYTEWFVKFKYPGHEKVKMVDGIPESWIAGKLGEKIVIKKGKNITKNTITLGDVPVIAGGMEPAYYHNQFNASAPVITISASGANAGFMILHYKNIWASDCSYINNEVTPFIFYYYLLIKNKKSEIDNLQRGAAQPHVYPKDLMSLKILIAPDSLISEFETVITPYFDLIAKLNAKNLNLIKIRELLIPQLVTGRRELKA